MFIEDLLHQYNFSMRFNVDRFSHLVEVHLGMGKKVSPALLLLILLKSFEPYLKKFIEGIFSLKIVKDFFGRNMRCCQHILFLSNFCIDTFKNSLIFTVTLQLYIFSKDGTPKEGSQLRNRIILQKSTWISMDQLHQIIDIHLSIYLEPKSLRAPLKSPSISARVPAVYKTRRTLKGMTSPFRSV